MVEPENVEEHKQLKFDDLGLDERLLRGIYGYGFEVPSIIQQKGIPPLTSFKDTIAQAQSGTGKTATFSIGALQVIDTSLNACQGLIVAPTRELAQQIHRVVSQLGHYLGVRAHACVGGTAVREDMRVLEQGVHVVVGTPGRVFDMMSRNALNASTLRIFVLDESDEMLSRGFKDQILDIFRKLPGNIQVGLFSATMPEEILKITEEFMREPYKILVDKEELSLEGINQYYVAIEHEQYKFETLTDLYDNIDIQQAIIYANTKKKVIELGQRMEEKDFTVSIIHGDLLPEQREQIMKDFRTGSTRVLISTDLLARGIDVQQVNLVINYDLTSNFESYLHRIGRSGRFGRKGVAINFVTANDSMFLKELEKFYGITIDEMPNDLANI